MRQLVAVVVVPNLGKKPDLTRPLNTSSYVDSQGYPRRMSSLPMSVMRNLILWVVPPVVTARFR